MKLNPTLKGWIPTHIRVHEQNPGIKWQYRDSDEQHHYFISTNDIATVEVQVGDFDIDWDIYNGFKPRPPG